MGDLHAHGQMRAAITRYKYDEKWVWAAIFGRILVGFLNEHRATFGEYDLITPSPSYLGPGAARSFDHTRRIVEAAQIEEPIAWPFTYDVVTRAALRVPQPEAVAGKQVLLVDDVFTEGFTVLEVARALSLNGATEVSEIVLAREPWKGG